MSTSIQPREEVFPGYHLTERLGSGGYAEVWRARAPGEIDKAVKIVFGCYDDQLAVQELKALERIKNVRHPFVLSLERFEIVDGRLAILTELADFSLEQRAQQCRAQGLPGIPREELLRYLSDTAEALDFLADRHNLQHLDIKPANLLVVGDHVKVADFGLVKELATRTQNSMVAGMTPTYSSPEMFDDAPSPQSDQYSLAIVYQEMLTGVLPFPGRTTAQLANQHLHAQPQLVALAEPDRISVARALAKDPAHRFPSCRAFTNALLRGVESADRQFPDRITAHEFLTNDVKENATSRAYAKPERESRTPTPVMPPDSRSHQATQLRPQGVIDTKSDVKHAPNLPAEEKIVDVEVPTPAVSDQATMPTLYIAVGGIGIRILSRLRDILARRANPSQHSTLVEMIAIDTDRAEIKNACSTNWSNPLPLTEALHLPLKLPQVYREQGSHLEWLSHRWLYNIPRSLETRGYRPLGRLAIVDHVDKVLTLIDQKLDQLAAITSGAANQEAPEIRIVLLVGMGGGTGSGMVIDLANAVRSRLQATGRRGQVQGVLVCTCLENTNASPLSVANTYALLSELQFVSAFGNRSVHAESSSSQQLESAHRPFDLIYLTKALASANHSVDEGLASIASQLALASTDGACHILKLCQQTATPRELAQRDLLLFRTFIGAQLAGPRQKRINRLVKSLARAIEQQWLANASPSDWRGLNRASETSSAHAPSPQSEAAETTNVATVSPVSRAEEWRRHFGQHASTQFAYGAVSRVCRQSNFRSSGGNTLSSTQPARFIDLVSRAITHIGKRAADTSKLGETLSDEEESIVNKLAARSQFVLTKIIDEIEQISVDSAFDAAKIACTIATEATAAVEEFLKTCSPEVALEANSTVQLSAEEVLGKAAVDLLQCGYDRRTLIFVPARIQANDGMAALLKSRPTATVVAADVDEAAVFCEGSGISPLSLKRGFERVYPGIAEAARRLFTRIDIDWSKGTL